MRTHNLEVNESTKVQNPRRPTHYCPEKYILRVSKTLLLNIHAYVSLKPFGTTLSPPCSLGWQNSGYRQIDTHTHTHTQTNTHRPRTVTLAAHAHQELIIGHLHKQFACSL